MESLPSSAEKALGLRGKSAIVTGASRGIGEAVIKILVSLGVRVVGVSRNFPEDWTERFGRESVMAVKGDVADLNTANVALRTCLDRFGDRVDILVNNAGMVIAGTILDTKVDDWDRQMDVNLRGHLNFSQIVSREMVRKKTRGRIVNVSSTAALYYENGLLAYSATKGAIMSLTRAMAVDLAPYGILVNAVAPGWTDTLMGTGSLKEGQREIVNRRIPVGHIASPSEMAGIVAFLASVMCRHMTGQMLIADGGQTIDATIAGIQY